VAADAPGEGGGDRLRERCVRRERVVQAGEKSGKAGLAGEQAPEDGALRGWQRPPRRHLVVEKSLGLPRVGEGIVAFVLAELLVLEQLVVRAAGEEERGEEERVDGRGSVERAAQMLQVVVDDVVAANVWGVADEIAEGRNGGRVEFAPRRVAGPDVEELAAVGVDFRVEEDDVGHGAAAHVRMGSRSLRLLRPKWSRKAGVVPKRKGRPGRSLRPMMRTSCISMSALTTWPA
jgi:hypothetical protein